MNATIKCMKQIATVKRHRQLRMLRGKFENTLRDAGMSFELQGSALREFDRVARAAHKEGLRY